MGRKRSHIAVGMLTVGIVGLTGAAPALGIVQPAVVTKAAPLHTLSVAGVGLGMYPAFNAGLERYAVTNTDDSDGTISIVAATSDLSGSVWINGRRALAPATTLTGLKAGDEISVIFKDSGGIERHSLYYLPLGFPTLETPTYTPGLQPQHIFLTPSKWLFFARQFEAAVDRQGVPIWTSGPTASASTDFKRQPNGRYTVLRPTTTPGRTGSMLVEMNPSFQVRRTWETIGLTNTDLQSGTILDNGNAVLVSYEKNAATGLTDGIVQEQTPAGKVVFQWNTSALAGQTMLDSSWDDYAHVDSVQRSRDGKDLIVTLRHLSSVVRVARVAHDGFTVGDIVWQLGGRKSDFTFVNDPYPAGPCAASEATELPSGNILIYDTGSMVEPTSPTMCVNPADPMGPAVERPFTRVTEYALNRSTGKATLVWSYQTGQYGRFGGSAQRLANGNVLIGWSWGEEQIVEEVNRAGNIVWSLRDRDAVPEGYVSFRARAFTAPDRIKPVVNIAVPAKGARLILGTRVPSDFSCTDKGGSSLAMCGADGQWGRPVNTATLGPKTYSVTAKDGAGNLKTVTVSYTVVRR